MMLEARRDQGFDVEPFEGGRFERSVGNDSALRL
jgi:hypothetical protein